MLLMQRKSSENLLGFIFYPVLCLLLEFFFVSLSHSVLRSLSSSFLLLLCCCCCFFLIFRFWFSWNLLFFFLYRWNCSTFDVIPLRTHVHFKMRLTWRRGKRIFRYLLRNRKRNSPKCMEINAVIIPKSCGIKEAYNRLAVKIIFSLFWFYFILFVFFFALMNVIIIIIVDSVRFFVGWKIFHTVGPWLTNGMKQLIDLPKKTDN